MSSQGIFIRKESFNKCSLCMSKLRLSIYQSMQEKKKKNTVNRGSSKMKRQKINYILFVILHPSSISIFNACKWPNVIIAHHQTWISFVKRQKVSWIIQLTYWGNDEEGIYRWVNNRGQRQIACSQNNECLQHATSLWTTHSERNKKANDWGVVL